MLMDEDPENFEGWKIVNFICIKCILIMHMFIATLVLYTYILGYLQGYK